MNKKTIIKNNEIAVGENCLKVYPKFYQIPIGFKLPPSAIQFAINNVKNFFYNPSRWFLGLKQTRQSSRQQRTESREAVCLVGAVIFQYVDLATMRCGYWSSTGEFVSLSMRKIAKILGWRTEEDEAEDLKAIEAGKRPKNRGVKRVERVISLLKKAGFIRLHKRCKVIKGEKGDTKHKGLTSVKNVFPKFFFELGIKPALLKQQRGAASKRVSKFFKSIVKQEKEEELKRMRAVEKWLNKKFRGKEEQGREGSLKPLQDVLKEVTAKTTNTTSKSALEALALSKHLLKPSG